MANLTDEKRAELRSEITDYLSAQRESSSLTKAEWREAVNATDSWVESNKTSYNSALPSAAQGGLTAQQKALLIARVVLKRFIEGV